MLSGAKHLSYFNCLPHLVSMGNATDDLSYERKLLNWSNYLDSSLRSECNANGVERISFCALRFDLDVDRHRLADAGD